MSINVPTAHSANVTIPYGELKHVVEWCKRNCEAEWGFDHARNNMYEEFEFLFESERDYVAFLVWKK
jgi:hypothetical protein